MTEKLLKERERERLEKGNTVKLSFLLEHFKYLNL